MWYSITRQEVIQQTVEATYRVYVTDEIDPDAAAFAAFERGGYNTRTAENVGERTLLSHTIATVEPTNAAISKWQITGNTFPESSNALLDDLRKSARHQL